MKLKVSAPTVDGDTVCQRRRRRVGLLLLTLSQANNSGMTLPLRTTVIGRPVAEWYSLV